MDPDERIHGWTDKEIMDQLEKLTGDTDRDIEREALRRLIEKLSYIPTTPSRPV